MPEFKTSKRGYLEFLQKFRTGALKYEGENGDEDGSRDTKTEQPDAEKKSQTTRVSAPVHSAVVAALADGSPVDDSRDRGFPSGNRPALIYSLHL